MKQNEFCYWLQGALELCNPAQFTVEQSETIKRHVKMVLYHEKNITLDIINWLNGIYEFQGVTPFNEQQVLAIKEKLKETFLKNIDAEYTPEDRKNLHNIHSGLPVEEKQKPRLESFC